MQEKVLEEKLTQLKKRIVRESLPLTDWRVQEVIYEGPGRYRPGAHCRQSHVIARRLAAVDVHEIGKDALGGQMRYESIIASAAASIPQSWQGRSVYFELALPDQSEAEGLLYLNGSPLAGFDGFHTCVRLPVWAEAGADVNLKLEARMTRYEWESVAEDVALTTHDSTVESYYYDLLVVLELWRVHSDEFFRQKLWRAIEKSAALFNPSSDAIDETVTRAAESMKADLKALAGAYRRHGRTSMVGHSHLDIAWHWQLKETVRKCGRTFGTALNLMREYPEFVFLASQAKLYDYARVHYPDLYAQVRHRVDEGRWEIVGGAWVEFDANLPCGESLIRQHLHGQRYFEREFGRRAEVGWLPDTFGFSGNLPQIMSGCGLDYFWTTKMYWQSRDLFPHRVFWWEGIDGTRVLSHMPCRGHGDGQLLTPVAGILTAWRTSSERHLCGQTILPFGHGDGGGGPTRETLECLRRYPRLTNMPDCRIESATEAFSSMRREVGGNAELPIWRGELYLETHRGTFTTKGILKKLNRESEGLYLTVEKLASLLLSRGIRPDLDGLQDGWEKILANQFHDIMAGACRKAVHEDAVADYHDALAAGRRLLESNLQKLGEAIDTAGMENPVLVFNPLSWQRDGLVELEPGATARDSTIVLGDGQELDCQVLDEESGRMLCAVKNVPATGCAVLETKKEGRERAAELSISEETMENRFYSLRLLRTGEILVRDRLRRREVFEPGRSGNVLQFFRENRDPEDAYNIDRDFERHMETVPEAVVEVLERGALRGAVRVTKRFGRSTIEQDIVIYRDLPRIDFRTRIDWQESNVMLKAAFPVNVRSLSATFEIPYGSIERPTHTNTSWDREKFEVPAQRWADLSEPRFGVTIMNDSKYGYDVRDNVVRLTLLRSPCYPEKDADVGTHEFRYSLLTHDGDWRKAGVARRAAEFNLPLIAWAVGSGAGKLARRLAFAEIDVDNVVVEAVKKAEDSDNLVMRLYESHGARGDVTVRFGFPVRSVHEANMLEDVGEGLEISENQVRLFLKPFQIKTLIVRPDRPANE